jgi:2-desacetyl-2-hydroxyethyl bacteriochlorophyllide A dehydrogenase
MKAIICERPGQFSMKEIDPPRPKPGEALVRIRRVGICGTDLHAFQGEQPYFTYPKILGHELCGEIAGVGGNSGGFKEGDPVVIVPYVECGKCIACRQGKTNCCTRLNLYGIQWDGGMQEYLCVPVSHLIRTEGLSFDQMAMVECLGIGAHAVRRAQIREGELTLVIGAGPIGMSVMQFAKEAGAKVIAMDIVKDKLQFCRDHFGIDYIVDGRSDAIKEVEAITNGEYLTLVFDATGNAKSMMNAINFVAHGGRLVLLSIVKDTITYHDPEFHRREMTLLSSRNATREDMEHAIRSIGEGKVDALSFITHRAPLDQMIDVFGSWLKPETGVIKAVVEL